MFSLFIVFVLWSNNILIFNLQSEVDHIIESKVKKWTSPAIFQAYKTCIICKLNRCIHCCILFATAIQFLLYQNMHTIIKKYTLSFTTQIAFVTNHYTSV